ncbi:MAG: hypothetical protein ISN29_04925 [Gammaproteobacteria bacterium AqS3]|nr:hypothetical protein [Gammaproteobacteria bacterium AqS3]
MKPHKAKLVLERIDEVDEGLAIDDLAERIKLFGQLLTESAKRAGCENVRCQVVHVSHSSPLAVECDMKFDRPPMLQMDPFKLLQNALDVLPKGNIRDYQDKDRKYLEKIQKLMQHKDKKTNRVEVQLHSENRKKPKTYKSIDISRSVGEETKHKPRKSYDTVKGELKMVDLRGKKPKFMLVPVVFGEPAISCEFPNEMLKEIQQHLGQMVAVDGEGRRRFRELLPYKVYVNKIRAISGDNAALYNIRGMCPNLGGGRPSEQIVREIRDEWED